LADDKKERPDYAKLIVGRWEVTKTNNAFLTPIGSVFEFTKSGMVKTTIKRDGEEDISVGTYKVEKEKLHLTFEKDEKDPVKIKEMTERRLVLDVSTKENTKQVVELKRLK